VLARIVAGFIVLSVLALLLTVLLKGGIPVVSAAPLAPHVLFGQARTQDNTVLGSGLSVQARINNVHYAQSVDPDAGGVATSNTQTHATVSGLNYGTSVNFQVCADDPGSTTATEGGQAGQQIFFFISGIQAQVLRVGIDTDPASSLVFVVGGAGQQVDLIIPSLGEAVATPATSSDTACTTQVAATAPTATPTPTPTPAPIIFFALATATPTPAPAPVFFFPVATPTPTPTPTLVAAADIVALGGAAGGALIDLALVSTTTFAGTFTQAASTDFQAAADALVAAVADLDDEGIVALGSALGASAALDFKSTAAAFVAATKGLAADQITDLAKVFAAAASANTVAIAATLVEASKGLAQADIDDLGKVFAAAASANTVAIAATLVEASKGLAQAGIDDLGQVFAAAASANKSAMGATLVEASRGLAQADIVDLGKMFAAAAVADAPAIGGALFEGSRGLAAADIAAFGAVVGAGAAANSTGAGNAIAQGALAAVASGGGVAQVETAAVTDLVNVVIGAGKAAPAGATDAMAVVALNPDAVRAVGRVLDTRLWVPSDDPTDQLIAADGNIWDTVGSPAPIEHILGKFVSLIPGATVRVEDILTPAFADLRPNRIVNSYVSLTPEEFESQDISSLYVSLFVEKTWLDANQVHQWSVQFSRFDAEEQVWRPSPAKRIREDDERVFYSVNVPAFSTWSITGATTVPVNEFLVEDLTIDPTQIEEGDTVTVRARVTNLSSEISLYDATLWLNSRVIATQSVPLSGNGTATVEFNIRPRAGDYVLRIDRLVSSFTVQPALPTLTPAPPTPTFTPVPPTPTFTPVPPTPTFTPVPPTATVTPVLPTATVTPVLPTATVTPVPPTATVTPVPPTATVTLVPPTATVTPVSPTATFTPVPPSPTPTPEIPEEAAGAGPLIAIIIIAVVIIGAAAAGTYIYVGRRGQPRPPTEPTVLPPETPAGPDEPPAPDEEPAAPDEEPEAPQEGEAPGTTPPGEGREESSGEGDRPGQA
jgi:PGF-pre-PGF domain-containing protein